MWNDEVEKLTNYLATDLKLANKLPKLTAACSSLVLVTWLPVDNAIIDQENIAATAAMVQNFLLMLTANNMSNYWSSGGDLGKSKVFDLLGIPSSERLLAAVFIEYEEMKNTVPDKTRDPGQHRDKRTTNWIKTTEIA